jgi:hypothetical protein
MVWRDGGDSDEKLPHYQIQSILHWVGLSACRNDIRTIAFNLKKYLLTTKFLNR